MVIEVEHGDFERAQEVTNFRRVKASQESRYNLGQIDGAQGSPFGNSLLYPLGAWLAEYRGKDCGGV